MTDSATPRFWHALPHAPAPGTVLGQRDALPDGQATLYNVPGAAKPFGVLLLRSGQEVTAYVNRCAHFGVPLAAKQEHLIYTPHASITCNVHYARYRWADGVCESGECAGEALLPIPLTVDANGQISIAAPGADSGAP